MRRWDAPWIAATPVRTVQRDVTLAPLGGHRFISRTVTVGPGGRWSLACCEDGSVWYFDLSHDWTSTAPLEPRLLIPAFPPPSCVPESDLKSTERSLDISVDWTSKEALGPSSKTHFLAQFNVAVLICWDVPRDPVRTDIWNIQVKEGPRGPELFLGECLSTSIQDEYFSSASFCLYGPTLAYAARRSCTVSLVDWREVNGRRMREPFPVRYLHTVDIGSHSFVEVCLSLYRHQGVAQHTLRRSHCTSSPGTASSSVPILVARHYSLCTTGRETARLSI